MKAKRKKKPAISKSTDSPMINKLIARAEKLVDSGGASGLSALSSQIFDDSRRLPRLKEEGTDIGVKRYEMAMRFIESREQILAEEEAETAALS